MIKSRLSASAIEWCILRAANPVGRHQASSGVGVIAKAIENVRAGKDLEIWGDGSAVRDYFDVRDLAVAIELAALSPAAANRTFNVGSGTGHSVLEAIAVVESVMGKRANLLYRPARRSDVPINVLSARAIREALGWVPHHSLADAVRFMAIETLVDGC